jgi:phosphoribosylformylglycinamidine (FGAM) synthase-like enzyme
LEEEFTLHRLIEELIHDRLIDSAHDISEGGLFVTLTEAGFNRNLGYSITSNKTVRKDAWLFGEAQSRVVVSMDSERGEAIEARLNASGVAFEKLGTVTGGEISIDNEDWDTITSWKHKYYHAIGDHLAGHESEQALVAL